MSTTCLLKCHNRGVVVIWTREAVSDFLRSCLPFRIMFGSVVSSQLLPCPLLCCKYRHEFLIKSVLVELVGLVGLQGTDLLCLSFHLCPGF
ncbi:hypothetical protein M6B38_355170 [Iris pallida]|uniref:Uncharacterized protein n=1 Tax=Iris pallida TaxID=29817 RepID=A0AAX6GNE1_IRIPA|nr:hypothetical protein M6B38_355170 [Iris pallida]